MRWDDERYVRVYVRDTVEWLLWPWQSRALLLMVFRKVDRAGLLPLGKGGLRSLARVVDMPEDVVEEAIGPLLEDGCLQIKEGVLVVPNFVSAQETRQSDAARKRSSRDSAKNILPAKLSEPLQTEVTSSHQVSPQVTTAAPSGTAVTAVTASTAQHSTAWLGTAREGSAEGDGPTTPPLAPAPPIARRSTEAQVIAEEIRRHPSLRLIHWEAEAIGTTQSGFSMAKGHPVEWVLTAIEECAAKIPGDASASHVKATLVGFMRAAKRPLKPDRPKDPPLRTMTSLGKLRPIDDPALQKHLGNIGKGPQ